MPGQYVVITRAPGTQITALIYNSDHQRHVDGRSAGPTVANNNSAMGAYGVSLAQFQLTEDPFPGSVESLAQSLAGEITRLRFVSAQIKAQLSGGTPVSWYGAITAPGFAVVGARMLTATPQTISSGAGTAVTFAGGSADFNSGVWNGANPTRFTAPSTGKYFCFCSIEYASNATGRRQVQVGINGSSPGLQIVSTLAANGVPTRLALSSVNQLTATDFVEFFTFQDSGGNLNLIADGTMSIAGGMVYLGT